MKILQKVFERMNREISLKVFIFSHLSLLIFGLLVLGAIYYIVNEGKLPFKQSSLVQDYKPVTQEPRSFSLELNSPEDDSLILEKNAIVVSGKTSPQAAVIISVGDLDTAVSASDKGEFSKVVNLNPGLNRVAVSAFDNQGNSKEVQKLVYYSEEKIEK